MTDNCQNCKSLIVDNDRLRRQIAILSKRIQESNESNVSFDFSEAPLSVESDSAEISIIQQLTTDNVGCETETTEPRAKLDSKCCSTSDTSKFGI